MEGRCINDDANCRWNESFYKIDYDLVTLSIEDYILGLSVFHKNGSKYWFEKGNNSNNSSLLFSWPLKAYINKREAHQKCLTLDIPYTKNSQLHSIGVLFNLSMFGGNGVRPESGGFSIKLHYPQQILVSNTEKVRWVKALSLEDCSSSSLENDNCFDSYTMFFDIKNVEVISRRNKRKRKCMRDWEMYDKEVQSMLADTKLKCAPNHWNIKNKNLPKCKNPTDLQLVNQYDHHSNMPNDTPLPCRMIKSVNYNYEDYPSLTTFSNSKYPEINVDFKDSYEKGNVAEILFEFQVCTLLSYFMFPNYKYRI